MLVSSEYTGRRLAGTATGVPAGLPARILDRQPDVRLAASQSGGGHRPYRGGQGRLLSARLPDGGDEHRRAHGEQAEIPVGSAPASRRARAEAAVMRYQQTILTVLQA